MVEAPWPTEVYTVRVSGDFAGYPTQVMETTFTVVRPEVDFEGTRIQHGQFNLIFTGSGFAEGESTTFYIDGQPGSSSILAGADGTYTANVPAPGEPGEYQVTVEYPGGGTILWVTVPVMPTAQAYGDTSGQYVIQGNYFDPGTRLAVTLDNSYVAEVEVDPEGMFELLGTGGPTVPGVYRGLLVGNFAGATGQSLSFDLAVPDEPIAD